MPRNPLVRESVIGLLHPGPVQLAYLNYLVVQAVVLLVWWPKSELYRMVLRSDPPSTLLAVVIAVGITTAYHALRLGAEEVMAEGQQSLREWAVSTGLAPGRIVGGYLTGHLLQTLQMLVLSAPLLLAAFGICAADWNALGWSIALIAVQLTMWRLLAAVVYLGVGHHGTATYLGLRALLIAAYAGLGAVLPGASHIVVSFRLLDPSRDWSTAGSWCAQC